MREDRVSDVLGAGDRVVVLCTSTAQRAGRTWTSPQVHVWTFKEGKAVAFREYEGDQQTEDDIRRQAEAVPLHRDGWPIEMGRAVAYLASSDADYITGAFLRIDGGLALGKH